MAYFDEQRIIGSLVMNPDSIIDADAGLVPEMFSVELFGTIYGEFKKAFDAGKKMDISALLQMLKTDERPEAKLLQAVKNCIEVTRSDADIKQSSISLVKENRAKMARQLIRDAKISEYGVYDDIGALIDSLSTLRGRKNDDTLSLGEITDRVADGYFKPREKPDMMLGFPNLDDMIGGLDGGDMIVIGARPAVGKSAFAAQIAKNIADQGFRVGYFNLEMQPKQIYERFLSLLSGISLTRIRRAIQFNAGEREKISAANEKLRRYSNIAITSGSKSPREIRAVSMRGEYDLIIIDYLQLLKPEKEYSSNRYAEVGSISRAIKSIAMDFNIPVIVLSQLNRLSMTREGKEPTMAEIRESGDIEQDASVILLLWNASETDAYLKGVKVEKNRQGKTGSGTMHFDGATMRFTEDRYAQVDGFMDVDDEETPFDD